MESERIWFSSWTLSRRTSKLSASGNSRIFPNFWTSTPCWWNSGWLLAGRSPSATLNGSLCVALAMVPPSIGGRSTPGPRGRPWGAGAPSMLVHPPSLRAPALNLDVDPLFRPAIFLPRVVGQGLDVRIGERRLHQAPGPQAALPHHVDLGREQRDLRADEDPRQQPDHHGERPVDLAGPLELMTDVVPAEGLQRRPGHGAAGCAGRDVAPRQVLACE